MRSPPSATAASSSREFPAGAAAGCAAPRDRSPRDDVGVAAPAGAFPRFVLALAAVASLALAGCGGESAPTLPGYVEGEYLRLGAPFAGTLRALTVQRGDTVAAGAPVFALESVSEQAARAEAQARQRAAEAKLANLKTGRRAPEIESIAEQQRRAQSSRDLAAANLKRQQELARSGFVSAAALDDARTQLRVAEAEVASLGAQVSTAKLPARGDEIRAAEAEAVAAAEVVAQTEWKLGQRAVAAPAAGVVHDTYYRVGDFVPAGSPVASLLPPGNVKIRFYVPEPLLGQVRRGARIEVACAGCGAPIGATVDFVSDKVEFTPPVLYSKDNRARLSFLVEARPAPADAARLAPGQPVDVTLAR